MRRQAHTLGAEGVVDGRVEVEHDLWRGNRQVAKFVAVGTAIGFDANHARPEVRNARSLRLADGMRSRAISPVPTSSPCCVPAIDPSRSPWARASMAWIRAYRTADAEVSEYTQAFLDARETAMGRLQQDLFKAHPEGTPDAPSGIVGVTVGESVHGGGRSAPIVEFTAIGTAVAELAHDDPRRGPAHARPQLVVPLDQ